MNKVYLIFVISITQKTTTKLTAMNFQEKQNIKNQIQEWENIIIDESKIMNQIQNSSDFDQFDKDLSRESTVKRIKSIQLKIAELKTELNK